jgi:O-antigen ligase
VPPQVAALVYWSFILLLFYLDWRRGPRTSPALWVPLTYFFLIASRPVSMWLDLGGPATAGQVVDGSPVDRLAYSLLLALAVVILAQRQGKLRRLWKTQGALLAFVTYCLISLLWSDFASVAFKRWIKLLTDILMVWVVVTDPRPLEAIKRFLARLAFVLIPLSVLFVKYFPHLGREYSQWTGEVVYTGVTYNKNIFGAICLYWGVGVLWLFLEMLRQPQRRLTSLGPPAVLLILLLWALNLSRSATSLACFFIGTLLLFGTRLRFVRRHPLVVHGSALGMTAASAAVLFGGVGSAAFTFLQRDSTLTGRTELWQEVLAMAGNSMIGTGYESFWLGERLAYLWNLHWWRPNQAHNGYIELYLNLGWLGVALFVIFLLAAYLRAARGVRLGDSYASLRLAWVVIAVIYNFTEASFRMQNLAWVFVLFAVAGLPRTEKRAVSSTGREQPIQPDFENTHATPGFVGR